MSRSSLSLKQCALTQFVNLSTRDMLPPHSIHQLQGLPAGSPNLFNRPCASRTAETAENELANKTTECDKLSQGANGSGAKYHQEDAHCDACTAKPGK